MSFGPMSEIAVPVRPARPVRPVRCTYCSAVSGKSWLMTCVRCEMSMPRAATSVATRKRSLPSRVARHDALALGLREIAVEPVGVEALVLEGLGDALGLVPRVAEDDGALGVLDLEDAHELARPCRRRA